MIAWRLAARSKEGEQAPEPQRMPRPLDRLPWDVAQDEFGPKGADFVGYLGRLILSERKVEMKGQLPGKQGRSGTHGVGAVKDELAGHRSEKKGESDTHGAGVVKDEMDLVAPLGRHGSGSPPA